MKRQAYPYTLEDHRHTGTALGIHFNGRLYPEQEKALSALLKSDCGILNAATGFGKTIVALQYIAARNLPTLILVRSTVLIRGWKKQIKLQLGITAGTFEKGKDLRTHAIDIATVQSITAKKDENIAWYAPAFLKDYGTVIYDECHHAATDTSLMILKNTNARYVLGLTATIKRPDGKERSTLLHIGPIQYKVSADSEALKRGINQILISRFPTTHLPIGSDFTDSELLSYLASDKQRNQLISDDIVTAIKEGKTPLVLTHRVAQAEYLSALLTAKGINPIIIHGKLEKDKKAAETRRLARLESGNTAVLSTGKYFGEGTDVPILDTLFLVTPCAWSGTVEQYAGRIARECEGKKMTYLYDYVDLNIPQCMKKYSKRLRTYKHLGYLPAGVSPTPYETRRGIIYGKGETLSTLKEDCKNAKEEILINAPDAAGLIKGLGAENVKIQEGGSNSVLPFTAIIIDSKIVWFGSESISSIMKDSVVMIRIDDASVAKDFYREITTPSLFPAL